MKKIIIIALIAVVLIVAGVFLFENKTQAPVAGNPIPAHQGISQPPEPTPPSSTDSNGQTTTPSSQTAIITFADSGSTPQNITIKAGTTVVFKNNSSDDFWPASDPH